MKLRALIVGTVVLGAFASNAQASQTAKAFSHAGQAPQTWDHEPGPNDRIDRFQVIYIDDHTCPANQIKKFTAGSKQLGVRATRECVAR